MAMLKTYELEILIRDGEASLRLRCRETGKVEDEATIVADGDGINGVFDLALSVVEWMAEHWNVVAVTIDCDDDFTHGVLWGLLIENGWAHRVRLPCTYTRKSRTPSFERIGHVIVESGTVVVADPVTLAKGDPVGWPPRALGDIAFAVHADGTLGQRDDESDGVLVTGFGGDGRYPVYLERDGAGDVLALRVEFVEEVEDDAFDDE